MVTEKNKIEIKQVPDPMVGEYDVLCKTLACAVCSGTDNHIVAGHPYFRVKYPTVLGHEGIGQVLGHGPKVRNFKKGNIVTRVLNRVGESSGLNLNFGAFAEKTIVKDWRAMQEDGFEKEVWSQYTINRVLPKDFDPIESTMIITWRETASFIDEMKINNNESVAIIGSGATALAFADHLKNQGNKITVIGSSKRKKQFIKIGASGYIPYKDISGSGKLLNYGMKEIDTLIDCIGNYDNLKIYLPLLKRGGKLGLYGLDSYKVCKEKLEKRSNDFTFFDGEVYNEGSAHEKVVKDMECGRLNPWDYLSKDHIYPLEKITDALKAAKNRETFKSVIDFSLW